MSGAQANGRIEQRFAALKKRPWRSCHFVTAGDPNEAVSREIVLGLPAAGDLIELGMPFSDPMADGPSVRLVARALANGASLRSTPGTVRTSGPRTTTRRSY